MGPQGNDPLTMDILPDTEMDDLSTPPEIGEDVEITFVDEDEADARPVLRGQNEPDENDEGDDPHDDEFAGIDDPVVRERIQEEQRLRREAEARVQQGQEAADYAVYQEKKKTLEAQEASYKLSLDGVNVRIKTTREALKMAMEDEDRGAQVDLQDQLERLNRIKTGIEGNMSQLPSQDQLDQAYQQHVQNRRAQTQSQAQPAPQGGAPTPRNQRAVEWSRNNAWMNDPKHAPERAAMMEIDKQLFREGRDPNSPEYFTELSKRMARTFPNLGVKDLAGRSHGQASATQAPRRGSSPPVAGARSSLPPSPISKGANGKARITLGPSDRLMLQRLGIDVQSDKAAVKRYVQEKYTSAKREQVRRGA